MKTDIYRTLGAAVRGYRHELGWPQEELGGRSGLHPSYIGQIERGTKKISLATLQKLSAALKVKISDLLQEKAVDYKPSTRENNPTTCLQIGDLPSANYPTTCGRWWDKQVVG